MSSFTSLIPLDDGLLPKWLLFLSIVSIFNSIQTYATLKYTKQVYSGSGNGPSPATPLSGRTFGTWTFITSIVRFYAAYYITNPQIYQLAFWTFVVAFAHFMSEWLIFRSTKWGRGFAGPAMVSTVTLLWMWLQHDYYIE